MWRASVAGEADRADLVAHPEVVALPPAQIEAGRVFVAEDDAGVSGFGVLLPDGELDGLFVEPSRIRGGIGRLLLSEAGRRARLEGLSVLRVVANPQAVAFYAACGFEVAGEVRTDFGTAPVMTRSLA